MIPLFPMRYLLVVIAFLFTAFPSVAQNNDTSKKVSIDIINAGYIERVPTGNTSYNKLVYDVELQQGETMMYCDSAYLYTQSNNVEAFGNVYVIQPDGTQASGDYLRYTGNTKMAFLQGNVNLTDGKDNLWSNEVEYNLNTKTGVYSDGGTLQSDMTTVTSNRGVYNLRSKDALFVEEVLVYDPEYTVVSDEMGYNTETKIVRFFAPSVVYNDSSILRTTCGIYESIPQKAYFPCRSSVQTTEQYLEADTMDYNKITGLGFANGNVVAIDTVQEVTIYSGKAYMNEIKKTTLAVIKPVIKKMNGEDSLFIRADTFFTGPVVPVRDSIKVKRVVGEGNKKKEIEVTIADTIVNEDTSTARYFIGYHNVRIFSDSMQGVCDSIAYSQKDSIMRMVYDPVVWSRNSQMSGDTILLYMTDSNKIEKMYIPDKAFVASRSGPERADLFDQIQGKTLTGYFVENELTEVVVKPNAEIIFYSKDDNDAYLGVNQASAARLVVRFDGSEIWTITLEQDMKNKLTPLDKADLPNMKLNRFEWLEKRRPKTLYELFE